MPQSELAKSKNSSANTMNLQIDKLPLNIKIKIVELIHDNGWCGYEFNACSGHTIYDLSNYEYDEAVSQEIDCIIYEYNLGNEQNLDFLSRYHVHHGTNPDYQMVSISDLSIDSAELEEISEEQLEIYKEWATDHLHSLTSQINNLKK